MVSFVPNIWSFWSVKHKNTKRGINTRYIPETYRIPCLYSGEQSLKVWGLNSQEPRSGVDVSYMNIRQAKVRIKAEQASEPAEWC